MKTYQMWRTPQKCGRCMVFWPSGGHESLYTAQDLWDFSDGAIDWGSPSDECNQLALAIIYDATRSQDLAFAYWKDFAEGVLQAQPHSGATLSEEWVLRWILFVHALRLSLPLVVSILDGWEGGHHAYN